MADIEYEWKGNGKAIGLAGGSSGEKFSISGAPMQLTKTVVLSTGTHY